MWFIVLAPILSVCLLYFPIMNLCSESFQGKGVQGIFCSCFLLKRVNVFFQNQEIFVLCQSEDTAWALKMMVMVSRGDIPLVGVVLLPLLQFFVLFFFTLIWEVTLAVPVAYTGFRY